MNNEYPVIAHVEFMAALDCFDFKAAGMRKWTHLERMPSHLLKTLWREREVISAIDPKDKTWTVL